MSLAALMLAAIVVLRGILRGKGIWLLAIGILAVPLVVLRAVRFVPQKPLTRIDVSFIGYRIPLRAIDPCSASADPMHAGGVWIGGGERDDGDPTPDVVTMPGFRPHLAQICTEGAAVRARRFVVRTIQPGLDLNGQLPADAPTQRIVLDGVVGASVAPRWGECVSSATASMKAEQVTKFVEQTWRAQDETVERKLRARLLASMRHVLHLAPPAGQDVYCVDINSGAPRPCDHDAKDYRSMLFLWRDVPRWTSLAKWTALPPVGWSASDCRTKLNADGGAVVIEPPEAPTALSNSVINNFSGVSVRMISRRMTGGVADVNLPRAFDKFSPAPFRIGKPRVIRFARNGSDLLLFVDEPNVQLRLDDLFGPAPVDGLPEGQFDLTLGDPGGAQALVVNLASAADELLPKPVFAKWTSRIAIDPATDNFIERSTGAVPRTHHLDEIATFGADETRVRPLVLVSRVLPPPATWIIPLLAALLLLIPLVAFLVTGDDAAREWDIAAVVYLLLVLRWMVAVRALLDSPMSNDRRFDASLDGVLLLVTPIFIAALTPAVQRAWLYAHERLGISWLRRIFRVTVLLEPGVPLPTRVAAGIAAIAAVTWAALSNETASRTLMVIGYPIGIGIVVACAIFLAKQAQRWRGSRANGQESQSVPANAADGTVPAAPAPRPTAAERRARAKSEYEAARGRKPAPRRTTSRFAARLQTLKSLTPAVAWRWFWQSPLPLAMVGGTVLVVLRFGLMMIGLQEEIFGIRVDVFLLPAVAAICGVLSREMKQYELSQLGALTLFVLFALGVGGWVANDLGLLWVGGMALVLALPFVSPRPVTAALLALSGFFVGFLSPKLMRESYLSALTSGTTIVGKAPNEITFRDELQADLDRDHYRLMDTVQHERVEAIPSQLAREVILDRERVQYQATSGAWRAGFRESGTNGNAVLGAGYLSAKPIIGQSTFRNAAQSDYVLPLYIRSEFGAAGLLALVLLYVALFATSVIRVDRRHAAPVATWALALAAGTALFMIGGTSDVFPFSGKWPLFLAFASKSDFALGVVLAALGTITEGVS